MYLPIRRNACSIVLGYLDANDIDGPLGDPEEEETIRARIWRAPADGEERTLQDLGKAIGHSRDLRSHLKHVARQAETLSETSPMPGGNDEGCHRMQTIYHALTRFD
jgi:hypothetical protein